MAQSLGPNVALRIFEIAHGARVPVGLDVRKMFATVRQTRGAFFDQSGGVCEATSDNGGDLSIVLLRGDELANAAALARLKETFFPADFMLVFGLNSLCPISILQAHPNCAFFASEDVRDFLVLIRQIRSAPDLISIDVSDLFSLWSNRVSTLQTVPVRDVKTVAPPDTSLQGVFLSFPRGMELHQIDRTVDILKDSLPADVELVWRDGGEQSSPDIDVCISRQVSNGGRRKSRSTRGTKDEIPLKIKEAPNG